MEIGSTLPFYLLTAGSAVLYCAAMSTRKPPLVDQSKSRVTAWLAAEAATVEARTSIATQAALNERTLRLARKAGWDPLSSTLAKLEALIPPNWKPNGKSHGTAA